MRLPNIFKTPAMKLKANSPEILLVAGVGLVVYGTVKACMATRKIDAILDAHSLDVNTIKEAENLEDHEIRREITKTYAKTAWELFRVYAPSVAIVGGGVALIFKGHGILRKRYMSLAAAYSIINKSYDVYRKRVIDELGDAMDKHFRFGMQEEEFEVTELSKNGKEKTVKKKVLTVDPNPEDYSPYARVFDEFSREWKDDASLNKAYILQIQNYANDRLKIEGYLELNTVYKWLGFDPTEAGQTAGWVYKKGAGDSVVDFGLNEVYKRAQEGDVISRMWVNEIEPSVLLDFNCIPDIRKYAFDEKI